MLLERTNYMIHHSTDVFSCTSFYSVFNRDDPHTTTQSHMTQRRERRRRKGAGGRRVTLLGRWGRSSTPSGLGILHRGETCLACRHRASLSISQTPTGLHDHELQHMTTDQDMVTCKGFVGADQHCQQTRDWTAIQCHRRYQPSTRHYNRHRKRRHGKTTSALTCALGKIRNVLVIESNSILNNISQASQTWTTHDSHQGAQCCLSQKPIGSFLALFVAANANYIKSNQNHSASFKHHRTVILRIMTESF